MCIVSCVSMVVYVSTRNVEGVDIVAIRDKADLVLLS
jgi:hypothetical protein